MLPLRQQEGRHFGQCSQSATRWQARGTGSTAETAQFKVTTGNLMTMELILNYLLLSRNDHLTYILGAKAWVILLTIC